MAIKTATVTVNGQVVSLTLNESTGKYEAKLTAPADSSFNLPGSYFPASVKGVDTAGNEITADSTHSTFGTFLRVFVEEEVKPTIVILAPSSGAYVTTGTPEIKFKVLDNTVQTSGYSGIKKDSCVLKIGSASISASAISWESIEGGYIGTYTPAEILADGEQSISVDIKDNDGNSAETASCTFKIDTVAPSLVITTPEDGFETNKSELEIVGTTDDATSKPVTIDIKLNGNDCGEVAINPDGSFRKKVTFTQQGENTIVVTATDRAGKVTTITRKVIFNTIAPVIKSVVISPNPVKAGAVYTISVEFE